MCFIRSDPSVGVVRVAPNVSLDREKQPSYTFTVIAADQPQGSEEQKRSSALVFTKSFMYLHLLCKYLCFCLDYG